MQPSRVCAALLEDDERMTRAGMVCGWGVEAAAHIRAHAWGEAAAQGGKSEVHPTAIACEVGSHAVRVGRPQANPQAAEGGSLPRSWRSMGSEDPAESCTMHHAPRSTHHAPRTTHHAPRSQHDICRSHTHRVVVGSVGLGWLEGVSIGGLDGGGRRRTPTFDVHRRPGQCTRAGMPAGALPHEALCCASGTSGSRFEPKRVVGARRAGVWLVTTCHVLLLHTVYSVPCASHLQATQE